MSERYPGTLLLAAFFLVPLAISFAQQSPSPAAKPSPPAAEDPSQNFAAEPFVVQNVASVTAMKADGTGTQLGTTSVKIQSEAALRQFSVISIPFSSLTQRVEFRYVRAVHADGSIQETPVSDAMEQAAPVTREAPFYSDLKTREIPVRSLHVGDTLQWSALTTQTAPEAPNQFWGQTTYLSGAVVLEESHELRVPASLKVNVWTNPRDGAPATESTEGGELVYRWHHADLHPTVGAQAEAAKHAEETRLRTPEEDTDAIKGKLPSIAWTTFADWAAVGSWYRDLSMPRAVPDAAIKAKVAELTKASSTDLEKAQAIYNFVSMQIRYIGVSFGIGRYQPHLASEVLANQYGDCKDKHTLLAAMLAAAGLHADPVLIGAGIRFNPAVPSPSSFNHLITRLQLDGQPVWLDSTTEVAPWRALLVNIRDQEALAIPPSSPATIVRTPADLPYPATETVVVSGSLDKTLTSDSTMTFTFHEDDEILVRSTIRNTSPSDYGTLVQNFMAGLGFGGKTSDPVIQNLEDTSHPLVLSFKYHRVKEDAWGENRITVAFTPVTLPYFDPKTPPVYSIQLGPPRTESSSVELTLPLGWNADLPEATHARSAFATCDVTYRRVGEKLIAERRLVILKSKLPATDYKLYQAWYDTAGASGVPFLQLIPPISAAAVSVFPKPELPSSTSAATATTAPSDAKAADLVTKAGERIRSMDPDGSRKLLDQAKAINPTERGLWMGYGAVASMLGASSEATNDLKQELTFHPDEVRLYGYIATEQTNHRDYDGAIATIRLWVKAEPASPEAALALVQRLAYAKHDAEAVTEGKAAIARLASTKADDTALLIAIAGSQVTLGQKQEAAASVEPLLATVTDPSQINSIAYTLAEANISLPAAAAAQQKALASLDAESAGWTLTESPYLLVGKQNLLAAMWDTMAWILHGQSKDAEALSYIEAAAHAIDRKDIRDHFTAIVAALHQPALTRLAAKDDQDLRTFSLGPAKGRYGTAEVRFLIVGGKVDSTGPPATNQYTAPASDSRALAPFPGAEDLLRSADLHALLPRDSAAHLIRGGFVSCHGVTCELILIPLSSRP